MLASAVAVLFARGQSLVLLQKSDEIDRQFWSSLRAQPADDASDRAVTMITPQGSVTFDSKGVDASELTALNRKTDAVIERLQLCVAGIRVGYAVLALAYLPFVVSVYLSTTSAHVAARVSALVGIPVAVLFAAFSLDLIPEDWGNFKWLMIVYPYVVPGVLALVAGIYGEPRFSVPLWLIAAVPVIIVAAFRVQSQIPATAAAQLGLCTAATMAVVGCSIPYGRWCLANLRAARASGRVGPAVARRRPELRP